MTYNKNDLILKRAFFYYDDNKYFFRYSKHTDTIHFNSTRFKSCGESFNFPYRIYMGLRPLLSIIIILYNIEREYRLFLHILWINVVI